MNGVSGALYQRDLWQCGELRVVEPDAAVPRVHRHQRPVHLQVDWHQQQLLGEQVDLRRARECVCRGGEVGKLLKN